MKNNVKPPRRAQQFLRWFCKPELLPEIEGDLQELFHQWVDKDNSWYRRLTYSFIDLKPLHRIG